LRPNQPDSKYDVASSPFHDTLKSCILELQNNHQFDSEEFAKLGYDTNFDESSLATPSLCLWSFDPSKPPIERGIEKFISQHMQEKENKKFIEDLPKQHSDRIRFLSLSCKSSSAWLTAYPTHKDLHINDNQFKFMIRHRLGMHFSNSIHNAAAALAISDSSTSAARAARAPDPPPSPINNLGDNDDDYEYSARSRPPAMCLCGLRYASQPHDHVQGCKSHGGAHIRRHNRVVNSIAAVCRKGGIRAEIEPSHHEFPAPSQSGISRKRVDLAITGNDMNALVDVTFSCPTTPSATANLLSFTVPRASLIPASSNKHNKHGATARLHGCKFFAAAVDTYGAFHDDLLQLLKQIANNSESASPFSPPSHTAYLYSTILTQVSIAAQKGIADTYNDAVFPAFRPAPRLHAG
jgi:hypothetical protein